MNPLTHEFYSGILGATREIPTAQNGACQRCGKPVPVPAEERMARKCLCARRAYCPYCGKQVVSDGSHSAFILCEHAVGWTFFSLDKIEWWHRKTWCRTVEGSFWQWENPRNIPGTGYHSWEALPLEPNFQEIAIRVRSYTGHVRFEDIRTQYFYRFYFSSEPERIATLLIPILESHLVYPNPADYPDEL